MKDLRNIPAPVLARFAAAGLDVRASGLDVVRRSASTGWDPVIVEARAGRVETRGDGEDGPVGLDGYATVWDEPYNVGGTYGWTEVVAAGAADKSLAERDDVRLLFDHDGIPLARTKSGTMTLAADGHGLHVEVPSLDLAGSPLAQSVHSALTRGDLDEMSFAFQVTRQEWNGDYTERVIREVKLFDVSVVTYPANPATSVSLSRSEPPAAAAAAVELPPAAARGRSLALARAMATATA